MKKLRQLCLAAMFTLALTTATLAGDIATPGRTQPSSPDESIQNPQATNDSVADIALDLLQTMLSVF